MSDLHPNFTYTEMAEQIRARIQKESDNQSVEYAILCALLAIHERLGQRS